MPLVEEVPWIEPAVAFEAWADDAHVCWLDGAADDDPRARFSYLCADPYRVLEARGGELRIDGARIDADPLEALERELSCRRSAPAPDRPPFLGGAVGWLGYELCAADLPPTKRRPPRPSEPPDLHIGFYDVVAAFDLRARRAFVASSGDPETNDASRANRARSRLAAAIERLNAWRRPTARAPLAPLDWRPELSRADYEMKVERILEFLRAGDAYQVNFTSRWTAPRDGRDAAAIYRALRRAAPAPFGAFIRCGPRMALASASPERFLRLDADGRIETRPIKGSRPRGLDPDADRRLRESLRASAKDRAENLMIVDLMRNDLSRVAELGSVEAPALFDIESFSAMHHMVSEVRARLRPGCGAVDLLRAAFPPGSVTGAPKIRAMQIIEELEPNRRGPYCGAILWIGFDGAMDSSVVIRTLVIGPDALVAQAGGGIVLESDPLAEYDECLAKVRPLLEACGSERREKT